MKESVRMDYDSYSQRYEVYYNNIIIGKIQKDFQGYSAKHDDKFIGWFKSPYTAKESIIDAYIPNRKEDREQRKADKEKKQIEKRKQEQQAKIQAENEKLRIELETKINVEKYHDIVINICDNIIKDIMFKIAKQQTNWSDKEFEKRYEEQRKYINRRIAKILATGEEEIQDALHPHKSNKNYCTFGYVLEIRDVMTEMFKQQVLV